MLCSGRATAKKRLIFGQAGLGRAAWAIGNMPAGRLYFCLSVFLLNVSITVTMFWSGDNFQKCFAVCTPTVFSDALSFSVYVLKGFHMCFISALNSVLRLSRFSFQMVVQIQFIWRGDMKTLRSELCLFLTDVLNIEKHGEVPFSFCCLPPPLST